MVILMAVSLMSCSSLKHLPFSSYPQWKIDRESGLISNTADSTVFRFYEPGHELVNREDCNYGAPFITSANYDKENIFSKYIAECLKSIPCHIDSIWFVLNDEFVVFEFTNDRVWSPHYVINESGTLNVTLEDYPPTKEKRQYQAQELTPNLIFRNIFVSKRVHRIIAVDRLIINHKPIGIAYIHQSYIKKYPFCAYPFWNVTDPRSVESEGIILEKYKNTSIDILKRNIKGK